MIKNNTTKKTYLYLGFFLIIFLAAYYLGLLRVINNAGRSLLTPFLASANRFRIYVASPLLSFSGRRELENSLSACRADLTKINAIDAELKLLASENDLLRSQLNFVREKKAKLISAELLGGVSSFSQQVVAIDKGARDGVEAGRPVVAGGGILVGRIFDVKQATSLVRLINDYQSKVGGLVLNESKSSGVVEGGFGLTLRMNFIPRNESVSVGDKIVSSGLEEGMPKGLVVGTVAVVENEAFQPFQQAVLTPAIDLSKLSIVGVFIGGEL